MLYAVPHARVETRDQLEALLRTYVEAYLLALGVTESNTQHGAYAMLVPKTLAFAVLRRRKQATEFGAMWELLDGHAARQTANIADVWTGSFRLGEQLDACATYHLTLLVRAVLAINAPEAAILAVTS